MRRIADGSELPVVAAPGGKVYVVSEEGLEYDGAAQLRANNCRMSAAPTHRGDKTRRGDKTGQQQGFCMAASDYSFACGSVAPCTPLAVFVSMTQ